MESGAVCRKGDSVRWSGDDMCSKEVDAVVVGAGKVVVMRG